MIEKMHKKIFSETMRPLAYIEFSMYMAMSSRALGYINTANKAPLGANLSCTWGPIAHIDNSLLFSNHEAHSL